MDKFYYFKDSLGLIESQLREKLIRFHVTHHQYNDPFLSNKYLINVEKKEYSNEIFIPNKFDEIFKLNNGEYTGQKLNDLPNGFGICVYSDGTIYTGEWLNGLWEGDGIIILSNGEKYVGEFKNGLFDGNGDYFFKKFSNTYDLYSGGWISGRKNGKGYLHELNKYDSKTYFGYFKDDEIQGDGIFSYGGIYYEGKYSRKGNGRFHLVNGDIWVGDWTLIDHVPRFQKGVKIKFKEEILYEFKGEVLEISDFNYQKNDLIFRKIVLKDLLSEEEENIIEFCCMNEHCYRLNHLNIGDEVYIEYKILGKREKIEKKYDYENILLIQKISYEDYEDDYLDYHEVEHEDDVKYYFDEEQDEYVEYPDYNCK